MKKQLLLLLLTTVAFSQSFKDLTERPIYNPIKIDNPIKFDGVVDNDEWAQAQIVTNFNGSGTFQGKPADLNTEARLFYDDKNLYIAFKAFVDKEDLRYSITKRDNLDERDDRVFINIDAFDDEALTYGIGVSAGGAQIDGRATYGFDQSLDIIYDSKVTIFEDRYEVEMVIPFSSLRYSVSPVQTWRIDFGRGYTLSDEIRRMVYWTSRVDGIECQTCQLGFLKDIKPPMQDRGEAEYIPSLVAGYGEDLFNDTTSNSDELSLFIKYPISSVDLLEVAFNPDFSQIESDDIQNEINTVNALYFPEKRPFFSEGAELFKFEPRRGYINLFYSRTINDPSIVGKYTGKIGRTSYGVISARDETSPLLLPFEETSSVVQMGKSTSNIVRAKRMIGNNGGSIGAIITNRIFDNAGDMTTGGLDVHYHPGNNYHLTLHATASVHNESENFEYNPSEDVNDITFDSGKHTKAFDGEKISGNALGLSLNKRTRTDNFGAVLRLRSPGFRTSNGFENNNSTKWLKVNQGKTIFYDNHPFLLKSNHGIQGIYKTNYTGITKKQEVAISSGFDFTNGSNFNFNMEVEKENFKGYQFDSVFKGNASYTTKFNERTKFHTGIAIGEELMRNQEVPELTDSWGSWVYVEYKLSDLTNLSSGLMYENADNFYDGYILRIRINHSFSSKLTMRSNIQYSDFSKTLFIEPLITFQPNAFSAFYFGVNDLFEEDAFENSGSLKEVNRQFFIKFQYLF